jgi:DeoR/GlpR family transcriptional regulator of sugar metabolism
MVRTSKVLETFFVAPTIICKYLNALAKQGQLLCTYIKSIVQKWPPAKPASQDTTGLIQRKAVIVAVCKKFGAVTHGPITDIFDGDAIITDKWLGHHFREALTDLAVKLQTV